MYQTHTIHHFIKYYKHFDVYEMKMSSLEKHRSFLKSCQGLSEEGGGVRGATLCLAPAVEPLKARLSTNIHLLHHIQGSLLVTSL